MAKLAIGKLLIVYGLGIGVMTVGSYAASWASCKGAYDAQRAELNRAQHELQNRQSKHKHEELKKKKEQENEKERQKQLPINIIMKGVRVKVHKIQAEKELEECENELLDIIERYHPEA